MPTYDYRCEGCGHTFDEFQSMTADLLTECPECKEPKLRRLIGSGAAIIFKGSGFYETDYKRARKPGDSKPGDSKPGDSKSGDSKSGDSKSGDAKGEGSGSGESKSSETKSDSKSAAAPGSGGSSDS